MFHVQYELRVKYIEETDSYVIDMLQDSILIRTFTGDYFDCMEDVKNYIYENVYTSLQNK